MTKLSLSQKYKVILTLEVLIKKKQNWHFPQNKNLFI